MPAPIYWTAGATALAVCDASHLFQIESHAPHRRECASGMQSTTVNFGSRRLWTSGTSHRISKFLDAMFVRHEWIDSEHYARAMVGWAQDVAGKHCAQTFKRISHLKHHSIM